MKYFLTFYLIRIALPVGLTHARNESFPSRTSSTLLILFTGLCTTCQDPKHFNTQDENKRWKRDSRTHDRLHDQGKYWLWMNYYNDRKVKWGNEIYMYICVYVHCLLFRTRARSGWGIKIDSDWQPSNKWSFESISQEYLHQVHSGFIFWICCLSLWPSAGLLIVPILLLRN